MKNFRSIRSILSNIPKALFQETNESDFMDYMLDAIKLLPQTIYYEPKIEVFEIIDGKVQLPKYVKQINSVMWQCSDPSKECIDSLMNSCTDLEPEPADVNPAVCKPMITYKMFLDSIDFYNINSIKENISEIDAITKNNMVSQEIVSIALTDSLFNYSKDKFKVYNPDSLILQLQWVERFKYYADVDMVNENLYQNLEL